MFRRTKPAGSSAPPVVTKEGGKGRPTPTRREAEAAARARAKASTGRKDATKRARQRRAEQSSKIRQAMRTGDERYLPTRDRGPVRRFVRDRIDSRLNIAEFLLPLLLVVMTLQYAPNPTLRSISNGLWTSTILLVVLDTGFLVWRLRRELRQRFGGEGTKGAVFYGVLRAMQLRFLRLPKPQVKLGQKLPNRY